jgi:hypothetical protein
LRLSPAARAAAFPQRAGRVPMPADAGLRHFDSRPFTLHEHCGNFSAEVRRCLKKHNAKVDPVAQHDEGWKHAKACQKPWEEYRQCGRDLLKSVDVAANKCKAISDQYRACTEATPGADCEQLELAAIRCAGRVIRKRMSGDLLSEANDGS